jgi:release factor glutamine methyltransferase
MPELAVPRLALIGEGAERLRSSGLPEPRREALRIWSELNGTAVPETLLADDDTGTEPERAARFLAAIGRRASGEPLPYVTGQAGFRHLTLLSDRRALIPRPETEGLVELLLRRVRAGVVADVGTGSGCIAFSLALEAEFESILGIDCSVDALALARLNHNLLEAPPTVHFVRGDLGTCLGSESLDALISNPPYLTLEEYERLDPAVREWEPAVALRSGGDGLAATTRLLDDGRRALRPGGWLALEVDCTRASAAARLASSLGWRDVSLHLDLFGRERYLLARRSDTR